MNEFKRVYISAESKIGASDEFKMNTSKKLFEKAPTTVKRPIAILAVTVVLVMLFAGTVYAVSKFREVSLSESAQFSSATDIYAEKVNRSIEYDGLRITLSEALYENGKLYVTFNFQSEEYADAYFVSPDELENLIIDGKEVTCTRVGYCEDYNGILLYTVEYDLTETELKDTHSFTVGFNTAEVMMHGGKTVKINGDWDYSFSLNTSALENETEIYNIGQEIILNNGDVIRLEKIVCTPLSQRIYYTMDNYSSYRVSAVGDGCEFVFSEILSKKGEAVNIFPDNFDFNAEQMTLSITVCDRYENILADSIQITCNKE